MVFQFMIAGETRIMIVFAVTKKSLSYKGRMPTPTVLLANFDIICPHLDVSTAAPNFA